MARYWIDGEDAGKSAAKAMLIHESECRGWDRADVDAFWNRHGRDDIAGEEAREMIFDASGDRVEISIRA